MSDVILPPERLLEIAAEFTGRKVSKCAIIVAFDHGEHFSVQCRTFAQPVLVREMIALSAAIASGTHKLIENSGSILEREGVLSKSKFIELVSLSALLGVSSREVYFDQTRKA